jgi:hypothetical protein
MINSYRLPLNFDPNPLKADLEEITPGDWVAHFNTGYFEGQWSGVALRSVGGKSSALYPDPQADGEVLTTPILERCLNLQRVIEMFECPIRSARLLKLGAGSRIKEHRDYNLEYSDGEIRLHIPIATAAEVDFFLAGNRVEMHEGECWYLNFNLPHYVENRSAVDRIHLVVDCVVDDWLRGMLPVAELAADEQNPEPAAPIAPRPEEWERFRLWVLQHPELQQRLRSTGDRGLFIRFTVELGAEHCFHFSATDVETALKEARRIFSERWIP